MRSTPGGVRSTTLTTCNSGGTGGTCAETEITPVESSGTATSNAATTISAVKANAIGQRLRLVFEGADSSKDSRNMFSSNVHRWRVGHRTSAAMFRVHWKSARNKKAARKS